MLLTKLRMAIAAALLGPLVCYGVGTTSLTALAEGPDSPAKVAATKKKTKKHETIPKISPDDFHRLLLTIKPQPGESPWREIPWLTNVTEARRQAGRLDRPLVIFTAADGSPLSRT